jgi:hypothetical protein
MSGYLGKSIINENLFVGVRIRNDDFARVKIGERVNTNIVITMMNMAMNIFLLPHYYFYQ